MKTRGEPKLACSVEPASVRLRVAASATCVCVRKNSAGSAATQRTLGARRSAAGSSRSTSSVRQRASTRARAAAPSEPWAARERTRWRKRVGWYGSRSRDGAGTTQAGWSCVMRLVRPALLTLVVGFSMGACSATRTLPPGLPPPEYEPAASPSSEAVAAPGAVESRTTPAPVNDGAAGAQAE